MSVPVPLRGKSGLTLLYLVMKLASYTLNIVNSEKRFPKRYRWCITSKIANSAVEILNNVNMANEVYVVTKEDYKLRRRYQKIALCETRSLLGMVDIATTTFNLQPSEKWVDMIKEVKNKIQQWVENDAKRYKDIV